MLVETPWLLLNGNEAAYLKKMKEYYKAEKITFPEKEKNIILFVSDDNTLLHILRWNKPWTWKLSEKMNPYRAHRILRIKFVVENKEVRNVYKCKNTHKIIFACEDLKYCVFCSYQKWKDRYKIITAYFKWDFKCFKDTTKYEKIY